MSDVFQEVDEELKRQQVDKALRTYGPWIAMVAVVIIAGYAGFTFWQNYKERQAAAAGDGLIAGMELLVRGQQDEAVATFAQIAEDAPGGYPMMAKFQEAAAQRQSGESEAALALYDEIAASSNTPREYRDLARYYGGLTALSVEGTTYDQISGRLMPVADGNGPWRFHAREILGFAAYREGQFEIAANHYQQITDDPLSPSGVASRATEMLNLTEAAAE